MTYQLQFHHFEHPMNLDCHYLKSQTPQDLRHSIMTGPLVCPQSQFVRSHHYHLEKKTVSWGGLFLVLLVDTSGYLNYTPRLRNK